MLNKFKASLDIGDNIITGMAGIRVYAAPETLLDFNKQFGVVISQVDHQATSDAPRMMFFNKKVTFSIHEAAEPCMKEFNVQHNQKNKGNKKPAKPVLRSFHSWLLRPRKGVLRACHNPEYRPEAPRSSRPALKGHMTYSDHKREISVPGLSTPHTKRAGG
jgi:hypothetical protein